jgi:predicted ATP-dependent endonuclease of OLD family
MLKKMTIQNFKAIQDMTIEFTPLTVLIGGNACGKTSILQALVTVAPTPAKELADALVTNASVSGANEVTVNGVIAASASLSEMLCNQPRLISVIPCITTNYAI